MDRPIDWGSLIVGDCLESVLAPLHAVDIGCLHATSKTMRAKIKEYLQANNYAHARRLLSHHVRQASKVTGARAVARYVGALDWLLTTASIPSHLVWQESPAIVCVPSVPYAIVLRLVEAGVRLTYEQLVSAARSQLEGIHHWVVAMMEQGIHTGMPANVEAVCWAAKGDNVGLEHVLRVVRPEETDPEAVTDLLFITLNTITSNTSDSNICRDLLEAMKPVAQQIDPETDMQLVKAAMEICSSRAIPTKSADALIHKFLFLPTHMLRGWPIDSVNEVLHLGLKLGVPAHCWRSLYKDWRPESRELNKEQVEALLVAAVPATVKFWYQQSSGYPSLPLTYFNSVLKYTRFSWPITSSSLLNLIRAALDALDSTTGRTTFFLELAAVCLPRDASILGEITCDNLPLLEAVVSPMGAALATAAAALSAAEVKELMDTAQDITHKRKVGADAAAACLHNLAKLGRPTQDRTKAQPQDKKQPLAAAYSATVAMFGGSTLNLAVQYRRARSVGNSTSLVLSTAANSNRASTSNRKGDGKRNQNSFSCLAEDSDDSFEV